MVALVPTMIVVAVALVPTMIVVAVVAAEVASIVITMLLLWLGAGYFLMRMRKVRLDEPVPTPVP